MDGWKFLTNEHALLMSFYIFSTLDIYWFYCINKQNYIVYLKPQSILPPPEASES